MQNRHLISYILFVVGVVLLLAMGIGNGRWLEGVLLGLAFALVGLIFYRRGK